MPAPQPFTVEALERERQVKLKEAVGGENEQARKEKEQKRDRLLSQIKGFQAPSAENTPTCTSYASAEAYIIKAMKKGAKMADLRLDLTHQKLTIVPADVLRLGDSLVQLSVVGNMICELPADLDLCRRLRVLNLACNELSGLPNLSGMRELIHVGLGFNRVTDSGIPALNRCLPFQLQSLDLSGNELLSLQALADAMEDKFPKLVHLSLKGNPLAIRADYKAAVVRSALGIHLTMLDGQEVTAETREGGGGGTGLGELDGGGGAGAEGAGDDAGEEEAEEEEEEEEDSEKKLTLRVTVAQLAGVPEAAAPAAAPAADADAAPPAEGEEGGPVDQVWVSFTILGKTTTTKAMPRAGTIDFEKSSVDLVVPRTVQLRDELIVHGVPFEVYVTAPEGDADAQGAPAEGGEAAPPEDGEAAAPEGGETKVLLGTVPTRWDALAAGDREVSQVCSQTIQPPAPIKVDKKGRKKVGKLPPAFTLSVAASITVLG